MAAYIVSYMTLYDTIVSCIYTTSLPICVNNYSRGDDEYMWPVFDVGG